MYQRVQIPFVLLRPFVDRQQEVTLTASGSPPHGVYVRNARTQGAETANVVLCLHCIRARARSAPSAPSTCGLPDDNISQP